jgi:hypothetical protein
MRNFISTPNLTLKRKLQETFRVYNIDKLEHLVYFIKQKNCVKIYI